MKIIAEIKSEILNRIRENENLFLSLEDEFTDGYWIFDPENKDTYFNARFCRILGHSDTQPNLNKILSSIELKKLEEFIQKAVLTDESSKNIHQIRYIHFSGYSIPFQISIVPLPEIKERKLVLLANQEIISGKSSADKNRMSAMVEKIPETVNSVFWVRNGERFLYVSPFYESMWGRPRDKLYESFQDFIESIHSDDRQSALDKIRSSIVHPERYTIEFRIKKPDGQIRWVSVRSFPVFNEEGDLEYYIGTADDTTSIRQFEKEIELARKKAEQESRSKSIFLANLSHEIRTPLNAILGFSEVLQNEIEDEKHQEYLDSITRSGKNLLSLINEIFDLSKIEAGRLDIKNEKVNIHGVIQNMNRIFAHQLKGKGLEFRTDVSGSFPETILFDENKLNQILLNLVGNAIKFTNIGFVKCSADVLRRNGDYIDFAVQIMDTGIGMSQTMQNQVFSESSFHSDSLEYGRAGLGLSICIKLTKLLGGSIRLVSTEGTGSTFILEFRNVRILSSDFAKSGQSDYTGVRIIRSEILVVDDTALNIELIKQFLKKNDVKVHSASSGEEAISLLESLHPHLIIMDLKMSGLDGFETTRIIKANPATQNIPVLCYTASMMNTGNLDKYKIFNDFLGKPLIRADLLRALCRFLPFEKV